MKIWFKKAALATACLLYLGGVQAADIVLDPGHGGKDPGAIGNLGKQRLYEKDIALDMSLQMRKHLKQQGFSVAMTRSSDVFHPLKKRLAYARKHCRKLFASVHVNAAKNKKANGVQTYVSRQAHQSEVGRKSLKIAQNVQKAFNPKSGVRRAGFMMLKNTDCPTVQLEMYYMSHTGDLKKLADKRQRHAIAGKLAKVLGKSLKAQAEKRKTVKAPPRKTRDKTAKAVVEKRKASDTRRPARKHQGKHKNKRKK